MSATGIVSTIPSRLPRVLRVSLWLLLAAVAAATVGMGVEAVLARRDLARHPAPGQFIGLEDGRRLHVQVAGRGQPGPTVVFEAGAGSFSSQWAWAQRRVAAFSPSVAYDRPGLGWSDPYPGHWDGSSVAADLSTALERLSMPKPYILVGHSLGATYARVFAHDHPGDVAGLVLVDPGHEDQFRVLEGSENLTVLRLMHVASRVGLLRVLRPFDELGTTMPPEAFAAWSTRSSSAANTRGFVKEGENTLATLVPQVQAMQRDLGRLPLIVLRAADAEWADTAAMQDLQAQLVDLSARGRLIDVAEADHYSIVTDPAHAATIADAVDDIIAEVR